MIEIWGVLRRALAVLLCISGIAFADPVVHLSPTERTHLGQIRQERRSRGGGFNSEDICDAAKARLFLCLCEESQDRQEFRYAYGAVGHIYSANPSARATFNGKPYQRIAITPEYNSVVKNLFRSLDPEIQESAAHLSADCIWGDNPDTSFFPLLKNAYEKVDEANRRRNILSTYGSCHAPRPEVAEMLVRGLNEPHPAVISMAISNISKRYRKGTDYGASFRSRVTPILQRCLKAPEADIRYGALNALTAMAPPTNRDKILAPIFSNQLRDRDGGVVVGALRQISECHCLTVLPEITRLLDDQRSGRLHLESTDSDRGSGTMGDETPICHYALVAIENLSEYRMGPRGFKYKYSKTRGIQSKADYQKEADRARAWLRLNP